MLYHNIQVTLILCIRGILLTTTTEEHLLCKTIILDRSRSAGLRNTALFIRALFPRRHLILHYTVLYYITLYYTTLYYTILHYRIVYCSIVYYSRVYSLPGEATRPPLYFVPEEVMDSSGQDPAYHYYYYCYYFYYTYI